MRLCTWKVEQIKSGDERRGKLLQSYRFVDGSPRNGACRARLDSSTFRSPELLLASIFVLILGVFLSAPTRALADDRVVRDEFLRLYQPHAERIQHQYSNIQLKYTSTTYAGNGREIISSAEGKYDLLRFAFLAEDGTSRNREPPKKTTKKVHGRNSVYAFGLEQKGENQHVITEVTIHGRGHGSGLCAFSGVYADTVLTKQNFLDMARDESVRFIAFDDCVRQGKSMKELKIECTLTGHGTSGRYAAGFYFSPDDAWICAGSWQRGLGSDSTYSEKVFYYEPRGGEEFPVLKRIEDWREDSQDSNRLKRFAVCEITEFKRCAPFPDSEFKLSAFGLPEPKALEGPNSSKTWLWLLAAALAAAFLYVLFARLRNRRLRTA